MENKDIINSREFKLINILIDQKVERLKAIEISLRAAMEQALKSTHNSEVPIRTFEEAGHGHNRYFQLRFNMPAIKNSVCVFLEEAEEQTDAIHSLMRVKLNLLNDYDFTRGDDSFQKQVFGATDS